jgi:hypothetical protein
VKRVAHSRRQARHCYGTCLDLFRVEDQKVGTILIMMIGDINVPAFILTSSARYEVALLVSRLLRTVISL